MTDTIGLLLAEQDRLVRTKDWLRSKHTSTWGYKGWDPNDDGECTEAAQWWLSELDDFIGFNLFDEDPNPPLDMSDPSVGGWSQPTLEQHEIVLDRRGSIEFGPRVGGCPGTGPDDVWGSALNQINKEGIE